MKWPVLVCRVAGGMQAFEGTAPFARAGLILKRSDLEDTFLEVRRKSPSANADSEVWGNVLSKKEFDALIATEEALRFQIDKQFQQGSMLWIFRPSFGSERDTVLQELEQEHCLVDLPEYGGPEGELALVCLVDEQRAQTLRERWALRSISEALQEAKSRQWAKALSLAKRAFVLEISMTIQTVALVALLHEKMGDSLSHDAYIQMAKNSKGQYYANSITSHIKTLITEIEQSNSSHDFIQTRKRRERFEAQRMAICKSMESL